MTNSSLSLKTRAVATGASAGTRVTVTRTGMSAARHSGFKLPAARQPEREASTRDQRASILELRTRGARSASPAAREALQSEEVRDEEASPLRVLATPLPQTTITLSTVPGDPGTNVQVYTGDLGSGVVIVVHVCLTMYDPNQNRFWVPSYLGTAVRLFPCTDFYNICTVSSERSCGQ